LYTFLNIWCFNRIIASSDTGKQETSGAGTGKGFLLTKYR
jgi:hypothetical protein